MKSFTCESRVDDFKFALKRLKSNTQQRIRSELVTVEGKNQVMKSLVGNSKSGLTLHGINIIVNVSIDFNERDFINRPSHARFAELQK